MEQEHFLEKNSYKKGNRFTMKNIFGMKISTAHQAIALICLLIGTVITWQIRSVIQHTRNAPEQVARAENLIAELLSERDRNQALFEQAQEYRIQIERYEEQAITSSQWLAGQFRDAQIAAGLVDLEGPGVVFTLNDSADYAPGSGSASGYLIHDTDLLAAINELTNAGAEAVSLNGERIIATTDIRCVGSTVIVNGRRYGPPFVIRAIGNPEQLETALRMNGGLMEKLTIYGIYMDLQRSDLISIPRYSGTFQFRYASPVSAAETTAES
jgi:uncharacterized protein YlxW (UPF0749 family)